MFLLGKCKFNLCMYKKFFFFEHKSRSEVDVKRAFFSHTCIKYEIFLQYCCWKYFCPIIHFFGYMLILCLYAKTDLFLQVSTSTGVKSHYFNLHVMVPTAFILGSDEYHTQAGNAISLVCIIENVSFFRLILWLGTFSLFVILLVSHSANIS